MSGKVKSRRRKVKAADPSPIGPHDWIYGNTALLDNMGTRQLAEKVIAAVFARIKQTDSLAVLKSGPGVITIQLPPETGGADLLKGGAISFDDMTESKPAFKRMALVGGERMNILDAYVGKRDGVIVRLDAPKGTLLGVSTDSLCEVPLSALVRAFIFERSNIKTRIETEMAKLGDGIDQIIERVKIIEEEIKKDLAEQERLEHLKYVEERKTEYADKNWGGW